MTGKELGTQAAYLNVTKILPEGMAFNEIGLTKREAFAMAAMQGLLSAGMPLRNPEGKNHQEVVALSATQYADALLDELAKVKP